MSRSAPEVELFSPLRYWNDDPLDMPELDPQDAVLDREDSLSERYAFGLGENLGDCRMKLPDGCSHVEIERGYARGLARSARHADIYLRKLLTLRCNAFTRGIPVSAGLTTKYLQSITVTTCPVSGVALTQGTQGDSDWSIDRLDNELGYLPGNVCFVSSRVNRLKGAMTFDAAIQAATTLLLEHEERGYLMDTGNGLLVIEASRLAALMAGPAGYAKGKLGNFPPMAMAPRVWSSTLAMVAGLHTGCARTRLAGPHEHKRAMLFKHLGKAMWRASGKLVEAIAERLRQQIHPCDIWLDPDCAMPMMTLCEAFILFSSVAPAQRAGSVEYARVLA